MDLSYPPEAETFRSEIRAWLSEHLPAGWGEPGFALSTEERAQFNKEWPAKLHEGGWICASWPQEYGGKGLSLMEAVVLNEEFARAGAPMRADFFGDTLVGPTILQWGTEEQKQQFLPLILSGQISWCQGFSEPDAGSDLASLRTVAVRDGDVYIVNGQKIWTSYAHAADHCALLARTDQTTDGSEGISILLVPMDLPGVEVRDIANPWMTHVVHETWFTDVPVPVSCLLGEEHQGWEIVRQVLANERVGIARHECAERTLDATVAWAEAEGVDVDDPSIAEVLGMAYATCEAARALNYAAVHERTVDQGSRRPMAAVSRAVTGPMETRVAQACLEVLGPEGLARHSPAERQLLMGTTGPIAAGSLEVQLNLIARHLGLPKG
jgi:hypothetical protein